MTLRAYPEYKESGQAWLGKIPSHWEVRPSKSVFGLRNESERPGDEHLTPSQTLGVLPQSEYMRVTGNRVVLALAGTTMKHVEVNDFVIHLRSFQGGIEWSGFRGKVSPAYTVLHPYTGVSATYFRYLLKSRGYIETIASLTDQLRDGQSMRYYDFGKTPLPLPPIPEQQSIAEYLDWETNEIDSFIADQEELIALLNERRTATITETVTKGLNPNAIMKDSGVAWMGMVPAHWDVHSGRRYFKVRNEKARENDVQLAASQQYGVIEQHRFVELTGNRVVVVQKGFDILKHVESGDFVISMRSFQGGLEYSEVSGQISSAYVMLAPVYPIVDQFFKYLFKSSGYISALRATSNLVRDGQALRFSNFAQVPVPMPPISEQEEIANHLTYELAEIDAAIADARGAIALSKERRAAVISAAVTGKIDVRDHAMTVKAIIQGEPVGVA